MLYNTFLKLFKNNDFREIDKQKDATKFYLLRSISKSKTLKSFCSKHNIPFNLETILASNIISENTIISFIKESFIPKTENQIKEIEAELNKMQNFDWGGSMGNNLEKNIVNNYVKKILHYEDIENALSGSILSSVYGYTLNSWYNHWSSIMIEEIFNKHEKVLPTVDLVEKIDFFIDGVPFDLKVTYFPEELLKKDMAQRLSDLYGSSNELTCTKRLAKELGIAIPQLKPRALLICLQNLLRESTDEKAKNYIENIGNIKKDVIRHYQNNPNELITWLYENQGEMRFDATNRFFIILTDTNNIFESWKLKRNMKLLTQEITNKLNSFDKTNINYVDFYWNKNEKHYTVISEILFINK